MRYSSVCGFEGAGDGEIVWVASRQAPTDGSRSRSAECVCCDLTPQGDVGLPRRPIPSPHIIAPAAPQNGAGRLADRCTTVNCFRGDTPRGQLFQEERAWRSDLFEA